MWTRNRKLKAAGAFVKEDRHAMASLYIFFPASENIYIHLSSSAVTSFPVGLLLDLPTKELTDIIKKTVANCMPTLAYQLFPIEGPITHEKRILDLFYAPELLEK